MADEKFSDFFAAVAVVGDEQIVGLQGGDNAQFSPDILRQILGLPVVYKALVSQSATGNPSASVTVNTLGVVPSYLRTGVGTYTITAAVKFTVGKTVIHNSPRLLPNAGQDNQVYFVQASSSVINMNTYSGGVPADGVITAIDVNIEVYP